MGLDEEFLRSLETLRVIAGFPFRLSSAYRCSQHNMRVSSTGPCGPHTIGAVDVLVHGERAHRLVRLAIEQGWTGIGLQQKGPHDSRFVHLDRLPDAAGQPRPTVWTY